MKNREESIPRVKAILLILLIILPLSAIILYSSGLLNIIIDPDGNQDEDEQKNTIKLEEISNFNLDSITEIEVTNEITWIGSKHGLFRYDPDTFEIINFNESHGLLSNYVGSVAVDNEIVWFSTDQALMLFEQLDNPSKIVNTTGFGGGYIIDILVEDSNIWVVSQSNWQYTMGGLPFGGLSCYDKKSNTWTIYNSSNGALIDDNINTVAKEGDIIWMVTPSGIYLFNTSEKIAYIWDEETITWRKKTDEDRFDQGLSYSYTEYRVMEISVVQNEIIIWPTSNYNVEIHNTQTNSQSILKHDVILHDIEIDNNFIYLGTNSNGVEILDRSNNCWKNINESDGLLSNYIVDIEIFNDQLWIASKEGVNIYQIS